MIARLLVALALVFAAPAYAQQTITGLPQVATPVDADLFPLDVQSYPLGQRTHSVSAAGLAQYLLGKIPMGPQGIPGPAGSPPTFSSVSATTLPAGSQATAVLGGTGPNAYTLAFGLPQGASGSGSGNVNTSGTPAAGQLAFYPGASGNTISPLTSALGVGLGGTGGTTASTARSGIGAAASGANGDITALTGLTTALPVTEGGTGGTTASAARSGLGAAASGANSDIASLSGLTTALSVGQGGTGSTSASGARTVLGAAASGANTDIMSLASPALGSATATTQAAGDSSTKVASTAFVKTAIAAVPIGGGAPSTINTQALPYTATAADSGKVINPTGTGALNLPSATAVSGWYAFIKKRDDGGAATLTPASGTIDGLPSIIAYKEEFAVYYDAGASTAAGAPVYRTQGRQRGWIDFGAFTVASGTAAVSITAGAGDSEIRDVETDFTNLTLSATANANLSVLQGGSAGTQVGAYFGATTTTAASSAISGVSAPLLSTTTTGPARGRFTVLNIQYTPANTNGIDAISSISTGIRSTSTFLSTAGAVSSVSLTPSTGTITSMLYNVKLFRP